MGYYSYFSSFDRQRSKFYTYCELRRNYFYSIWHPVSFLLLTADFVFYFVIKILIIFPTDDINFRYTGKRDCSMDSTLSNLVH